MQGLLAPTKLIARKDTPDDFEDAIELSSKYLISKQRHYLRHQLEYNFELSRICVPKMLWTATSIKYHELIAALLCSANGSQTRSSVRTGEVGRAIIS